MERAGFFVRAVASLIDGAIVLPIMGLVSWATVIAISGYEPVGWDEIRESFSEDGSYMWAIYLSAGITALVYYLMEALLGRSPGKLAMRLRLTNAEGGRPSSERLVLRFLMKQIDLIVLVVAALLGNSALVIFAFVLRGLIGVGELLVFGRPRLAFHDLVTGTAVYFGGLDEQPLPASLREHLARGHQAHPVEPRNPFKRH